MVAEDKQERTVLNKLGLKSQIILQTIYELGGSANTTEIKNASGIENNDDINYRYERAAEALKPNGLIELYDPGEKSNKRNPPFEATLTEKGERLAKHLADRGSPDELPFNERLNKIETALETLEETIDKPSSERKLDGTDIDSRLEKIEERVAHLEGVLLSDFGAWSTEKQREYEIVVDGTRAMRDFLINEHGEDFERFIREDLG